MSVRVIPNKRNITWLTVGLAAAYALVIALIVHPSGDAHSKAFEASIWEALFAGPVVLAAILSILVGRFEGRIILLVFAIGYSILTATAFYWTFGFEHDAQYQLTLLLIPLFGFPSVVASGLIAATMR